MASNVSPRCLYYCFMVVLCLASVVIYALSREILSDYVGPRSHPRKTAEVRHKNEEPRAENTPDSNHEWIMAFKKRLFETGPNATSTDTKMVSTDLPDCPEVPPNLVGNTSVNLTSPTFYELYLTVTNVEPGGRWKPANCKARHRVAIIIPFRDREEHLLIMLRHLHPFLQRQQLDYGIFVVEPAGLEIFNKGSVMNSGFAEAMKIYDFQCVAFHDVDMLPENDKMIYSCPQRRARHMAVAVDKFKYVHSDHLHPYLFGGVVMFTPKAYYQVNGYTNQFAGWGGEDDEMHHRVTKTVGFTRGSAEIMRYTMIKHEHDKKNPINKNRWTQLSKVMSSKERWWEKDGLTTVNYVVLKKEERRLYTWIYVGLFKPRSGQNGTSLQGPK